MEQENGMSDHVQRLINCPFYINNSKTKSTVTPKNVLIHCEAGRVKCPSRADAISYIETYCAGAWQGCTLAKMLNAAWERK